MGRARKNFVFTLALTAPVKKMMLVASVLVLPAASQAAAGQTPSQQSDSERETVYGQASVQRVTPSHGRRAADLVADNLDRVAASADQILEVVNRDAGLMVELKRILAEDAGASGQLLEESDLNESAIADRLYQDLHTRVLVTRFLQRYGYLLPKVNPDSQLAKEQNLLLQARVQAEIARAGQNRNEQGERAVLTGCSTSEKSSCSSLAQTEEHEMFAPAGNESPLPQNFPEKTNLPRELQPDSPIPSTKELLLTSAPQSSSNGAAYLGGHSATGTIDGPFYATAVPSDFPLSTDAGIDPRPSDGRAAASSSNGRRNSWPMTSEKNTAEFGPAYIEHRPNPYADAPSLYDLYVQAANPLKPMERFGLNVFRRGAVKTENLPMDLPVGPDYIVGPGDSLSIDLWGGVLQRLQRTVDREGRLLLPEAGPLTVSGKSLGEVQDSVQRILRTQFRDISADVSLMHIRSVRVYVVGEVAEPGAYDVSALSTPLNALFAAGGVTPRGSLRRLEHYRGNQLLEKVDAYDLLLHGVRGEPKRLENGDSLRVPPLGATVTVDGMVRRPAVYELQGEKNLEEALDLAGGILPAAAVRHIEVQRLEAHEKRTMLSLDLGMTTDKDGLRAALEKFEIHDGDEIHIFPIAPYNSDAVYLEGHVLRPGRYSYHPGMKLGELLSSYKDLLPEPAVQYGEIIRITPPANNPVVESFHLGTVLEHPESSPELQPLDTVRVFGRYDVEAAPEFTVLGEVRTPGRYRASGREHLRDAVYEAGGITPEAWQDNAQVFRALPGGGSKVLSVSLRSALEGDPLNNIRIEPGDRILVHREPERVNPPSIYVRGEVARPGRYPFAANMRVSDLVRSAGGLLRSANPASGDLTRYSVASGPDAGKQSAENETIQLSAALAGDPTENVPLHDGDVLTIPQQAGWKDVGATVTLRGEVAHPGVYGIQPGERLSSLLQRAGGFLTSAYPQAAVFERIEARERQQKSREELIQRVEAEATMVKTAVNTTASEEVALQQAAAQQRERVLEALRKAPVSGRIVVRIRYGEKGFAGSTDDVELRAGDRLEIPKRPGFVLIVGQVYNSNAITYTPGKNAGWYLSRSGGATQLANKRAIFIVRASGAVTSESGAIWSGGVLAAPVGPGDTIVVPERAIVGSNGWKNVLAIAQIAQSAAILSAVAIP
jgi:polysaccharide biosynthesis/export protein